MKNKISRDEYGPEGWFNDGVIVHEDIEKPCHVLKYCPYIGIIEAFWPRLSRVLYIRKS